MPGNCRHPLGDGWRIDIQPPENIRLPTAMPLDKIPADTGLGCPVLRCPPIAPRFGRFGEGLIVGQIHWRTETLK
jgi:hypothetical protein